jgi:hypothetical protein
MAKLLPHGNVNSQGLTRTLRGNANGSLRVSQRIPTREASGINENPLQLAAMN